MKTLLTLITVFIYCSIIGQSGLSLQASQDVRLAIIGDKIGNDAPTANINARISVEGPLNGYGHYSSAIIEYEYADLAGGKYQRWSAGYAHSMIFDRITLTHSAQLGFIKRADRTTTWIFTGDLSYRLSERWHIVGSTQATYRSDLTNLFWRISGFLGLRFKI